MKYSFMTKGKILKCLQEICFLSVCSLFFICLMYACASVGTPTGGPEDRTPPRFVSSTPLPNSLNITGNKIEIVFDELIVVDKPMDKVIITPPQVQFPVIKAMGKKVLIELKDTLRPNTTYTIDFADAISDNNEKNPLENFSFAFSTGDVVDSLIVAGTLLNAQNLEPMPGILIGLHENPEDSAFTRLPFFRTSKTNERGQFWIRNIAPGTYRIYALNDMNRNYRFDQPGEEIAFEDSLVIPSFYPDMRLDTVWKDSITIDTIIQTDFNHFIPDDIVLFLFKEKSERQYLRKSERSEAYKFSLSFNAPVDSLPEIRFLNAENREDFAVIEYTEGRSILNYWLKDSLVYNIDTLQIEASFYKSDSLNMLVWNTDTLSLFQRKVPRKENRKDKDKKEEKIVFLGAAIEASSSMDVFDTIKVKFTEPLVSFDPAQVLLLQKIDTVRWDTLSFSTIQDENNPMIYRIHRRWDYEKEYKISIDSAAFTGIYGKWNDKQSVSFKTKNENEYGHLYVNFSGIEAGGFCELLDASDKVVRKATLKDEGALFMNLKPSKYYLRYIVDVNENGIWDTGNYGQKQHPERVYYYPGYVEIRQNWRIEQNWDVAETPIIWQKPLDITKNKPKEKKNTNLQNDRNSENNNMRQQNGSQNTGSRQPNFIPAQR